MPYSAYGGLAKLYDEAGNNRTRVRLYVNVVAEENYYIAYGTDAYLHIDMGGGANIEGVTGWTPYSIARPTQTSLNGNYTTTQVWSTDAWVNHSGTGYASYRIYGSFESWGTYGTPTLTWDTGWTTSGLSDYTVLPGTPSAGVTRGGDGTSMTVTSSIPSSAATITDYNYRWSTDNSSWSSATAMGTGRSAVFTGTSTQDYYFQTRAYSSEGWGGWSSSVFIEGVPTAPTSVVGTASSSVSGRINVSWTAPSNVNGGITNYHIYRGDTYVGQTGNSTTSYADDGGTRGTSYTYKIRAYNASGYSAFSSPSTATQAPGVPYAPTLDTVVASANTFGKVTLNWTKPSTAVGTITDYYLYADGVVKTSVTGEDTLTGDITGLNPRQTYSFTIRARNTFAISNGLTGDLSNAISRKSPGAPTAPRTLTSVAPFSPPGTVDLSWLAPTDVGAEGAVITGYTVYLSGSSTPIKTTLGTGTTTTVEGLIPATTYSFVVRARNGVADLVGTFSDPSNTSTATAQGEPEAPTNLTIVSDPLVAGRLVLTWTPPVGYNTGFRVYTGADVLVANVSTPRLEIDGLTPNTSYSYNVRARNPLTDLTNSPGGPASTTVAGLVGGTSTQTVPSISVTNNTNGVFVGTFPLVSTTSTTMSYNRAASNVPFASIPVGGGSTANNTNINLNGTGAYTITAPTSTSITFTKAGSDILANTSTPSGTMTNSTNAIFNGSYTVLGSPAPDPVAKTVSYTKVSSNISSRAASGTITNNSNAVFNGQHTITDVTENTIVYPKTSEDIAESNAFGVVDNKTNTDIFNGSFTLSDTPDHKTIEYSTGDLTYGENLITNPSMETVQSGSTILRTNLCVNPAFEANVTGWTGTSASIARSSAYAHSGTYSGLVTPGSTSGSVAAVATTVSGEAHRVSAWVYSEEATTLRMSVVSPATTGSTFNITADTWTRIDVSFTADTTTTTYSIDTVGSTQPFYLDDVLLEQTSELRPYFSGATTDALGWDYGWTGTANASTSTAKAQTAARANLLSNPSFETATTSWYTDNSTIARSSAYSKVGTYSLLVTPSTNAGGAMLSASLPYTSETHTLSAWVYATSTKNIKVVLGATESSVTTVAANTWTRVSLTFAASGTVFPSIRGTDSTTPFYVDAAMVEKSDTVGSYIEGSIGFAAPVPAQFTTSSAVVTGSYGINHSGNLSALVTPSSDTCSLDYTATTVADTVYTFSVWVYATSARNLKLSADATEGSVVAVPATTWTRLSLSFTAADTSTILSILSTDSSVAFYVDDMMLQESSTVQAYFDGDTDASTTTWPVVYSWAGTPHASISTREVGETLPPAGAEILPPYGAASREQSEAQLQIRYRSGWLG